MKLEMAVVLSQEEVYDDTYLMWLSCAEIASGAAPGRFLMVLCRQPLPHGDYTYDPFLPRPMSFHRFGERDGKREFAILYDVRGRGTAWLSTRSPGDELPVFGPLGRGFSLAPSTQNVLLVAGGIGVAALAALSEEAVAAGKAVTLLQGARTERKLCPPELFPRDVEIVSSTDDGSSGRPGYVTDLLDDYLAWADEIFACGPTPMFSALAKVTREARSRKPVQALLEEHMGCGTGVCYGCAVFTRKGVRLVCKDGPRFELREVFG